MSKLAYPEVPAPGISRGTEVEVRNRFDRSWSHGFVVVGVVHRSVRVARVCDGSVLPSLFSPVEVRPSPEAGS